MMHPLYTAWKQMRYRCYQPRNKDYERYGGRGITVSDQWLMYEEFRDWAFSAGWRKGLSLDRIDNDGPYSPANCRWTDRKTQSNNRHVTRQFWYEGKYSTARELYDEHKPWVTWATFRRRLYQGWPVLDAISFKKNERYKNAS